MRVNGNWQLVIGDRGMVSQYVNYKGVCPKKNITAGRVGKYWIVRAIGIVAMAGKIG